MAKRIPSLNWLRVFEAAARTSSFARAAERLAMSPPAVSQQIRALEEHLGRPLFERAPAGVTLTEEGRQLLVVASDSIGRMEAAAEALASPQAPPLVVAVSQTLYTGWLAPRLKGFLDNNRNVTLQFRSLLGDETPPRGTDLWIAFGQPPPSADGTRLFGETLVPVAHPDIAKTLRSVDDLLDHDRLRGLRPGTLSMPNRDDLVDPKAGGLGALGVGEGEAHRPEDVDLRGPPQRLGVDEQAIHVEQIGFRRKCRHKYSDR